MESSTVQYVTLPQTYFEEYTDANVVIQYTFLETGDTYEIGITSKCLDNEEDIVQWFLTNYNSRPVRMVGYCIKSKIK
jgi:hypothetical protein